jgi:hypothetical protein
MKKKDKIYIPTSFRLGKAEKWILYHAYFKQTEQPMPKGFIVREDYSYLGNCLFLWEVIRNMYPSLKLSTMKDRYDSYSSHTKYGSHYFDNDDSGGPHYSGHFYKNVIEAVYQSIRSLNQKKLLAIENSGIPNMQKILLTDRGLKAAKNLIISTQFSVTYKKYLKNN